MLRAPLTADEATGGTSQPWAEAAWYRRVYAWPVYERQLCTCMSTCMSSLPAQVGYPQPQKRQLGHTDNRQTWSSSEDREWTSAVSMAIFSKPPGVSSTSEAQRMNRTQTLAGTGRWGTQCLCGHTKGKPAGHKISGPMVPTSTSHSPAWSPGHRHPYGSPAAPRQHRTAGWLHDSTWEIQGLSSGAQHPGYPERAQECLGAGSRTHNPVR